MKANHSGEMITFTDRQFDALLSQMSRLYYDVRKYRLPNRTYNTAGSFRWFFEKDDSWCNLIL